MRGALDRVELHRMPQQAKRDGRAVHMQQDRVAHVRDGHAASDPRRAHRLARLEDGCQEVPVDIGGQRKEANDFVQHLLLGAAADVVMDAALGEQR